MSHYECKRCGQMPDKCECATTQPATLLDAELAATACAHKLDSGDRVDLYNALQALADGRTACVSAEWLAELERDAPNVDDLSRFIHIIDDDGKMGATALAENICRFLAERKSVRVLPLVHPAPKSDTAVDWEGWTIHAKVNMPADEKGQRIIGWRMTPPPNLPIGDQTAALSLLAASPARVGEGEKDAALDSPVAYLKKLPEGRFGIFCKTPEQLRRLDAFPPEGPLYAAPVDEEPTEEMVVAGFECEAWDALGRAVMKRKGWPYSCRESAECVTGIYKAMRAAMSREAQG